MTRRIPGQETPAPAANAVQARWTADHRAPKLTFVITGANRGIGLGLAKALSKLGHVIGTARTLDSADDLKAVHNVSVVQLDVSDESSVAAFAKEVTKLAPNGIDLLWNNAGISGPKFDVTGDRIDAKGWAQVLAVNCIGGTLVTNALLPLLRKGQKKGEGMDRKVVFTSSTCGSVASTSGKGNGVPYFSSKAALNSSTKYWHYQLSQQGFMVTPIHPGWVKTDMGGPDGAITIEESVTGMLKVVKSLDAKSELKLRVYDGSTLPW